MQGSAHITPGSGTSGLPKGTLAAPKPTITVGGNGGVIVPGLLLSITGRTPGLIQDSRKLSTKAGQVTLATRGSVAAVEPCGNTELNIKAVANLKNLTAAYELIKSRPGNSTPGVDGLTLDGISKKFLLKVQAELRAGTFEFPPARRISIPKPGKPGETRPLTIASPRDKVVQKALHLVLESYFEPKFLESSHGFRPGRGTHTAIRYLEAKFVSSRYVIEADFSKAFDSISHSKLMELIALHVTDEKLLRTIHSGLKAG